MKRDTHLIAGGITAYLTQRYLMKFSLINFVPFFLFSLLGSLLPDIDHQHSTIGKHFPFISKTLKHRGFTHSLLFICILVIFLLQMQGLNKIMLNGVTTGVFSHTFVDMFNPSGVALLYPSRKRYKILPLVKTGKESEAVFVVIMIALSVLYIQKFGFKLTP